MNEQPNVRTSAYRAFERNSSQSYLLADVIRRGGLLLAEQAQATGNRLTTSVAGMDLASVAAITGGAKAHLDGIASPSDKKAIQSLLSEAEEFNRLAIETVSQVLFIYMATIFEAFLEDLALLICRVDPTAAIAADQGLAVVKGKTNPKPRGPIPDLDEYVHNLFREGRWDRLGVGIFEHGFTLPFTAVCARAKTSPQELDRAKALRNLHVHNRGVIDRAFIKRVGDLSLRVGDFYPVSVDCLVETNTKLFFTVLGLDMKAVDKYPDLLSQPIGASQ